MSFFEKIKAKLNIKSKKQLVLCIIALISIVASLTLGGITLARYISEKKSDGLITPESFYFESNLLTVEGSSYETGTDSITFDLKNYDDNLRHSEVDINYTVSITCSDSGVSVPAGINTVGTLTAEKPKVTVEYNGLILGKTYTVTANATEPYTKSISATFTLPDENNAVLLSRSQDETGFISYLTLKTGNTAKSGIVLWQEGYVPYNAYAPMEKATGTSHNVTLEPNSVYVFTFFKSQIDTSYASGEFNFLLPGEFSDLNSIENYTVTTGNITGNGQRFYLENGANPQNDYSVSGYIDIIRSAPANNPNIQFEIFSSDIRFLICDSNLNGKFGYGYFMRDNTGGANGAGIQISETDIEEYDSNGSVISTNTNAPYPDVLDLSQGTVTLKWQVVLTGGKAYWYINNELIFTLELGDVQGDLFSIGALGTDIKIYGTELVAKSENEAGFNSIITNLGI